MLYALIGLVLVLAWAIIAPTKIGGTKAYNGIIVVLPPDEITLKQNQSPRGRRGQEKAEFRIKWFCGAIFASIATYLLMKVGFYNGMDPAIITIFFPALAAIGNRLSSMLTYGFDVLGHTVEILIAEEDGWDDNLTEDEDPYRVAEIKRMLRDSRRKHLLIAGVGETVEEAKHRAFATVLRRVQRIEPYAKIAKRLLTF